MPQPFGMTTDCRHNTQLTQVAHTYTHRDRQATTPLKFHSPRPPLPCFLFRPCNCSTGRQTKGTQSPRRNCCACFNATMFPAPLLLLFLLAVCRSCNSRRSCHSSELRLELLLWLCLHTGRAGPGRAGHVWNGNGNEVKAQKLVEQLLCIFSGQLQLPLLLPLPLLLLWQWQLQADKLLHLNRGVAVAT